MNITFFRSLPNRIYLYNSQRAPMLLPTKNSFVHPVLFSSIQQPINLVLGGGGMKGVAHVALLEYLEENQVPICSISGSSVGALVGAMYASGQRPADILYFFRDTPLFRYSWLNPIKGGLFDSDRYLDILKTYVFSDFADLEIPLYVVATNLHQGCPVYFREGDLYQTLLASCAVPGVFCPIEIAGELYSDGAIMDNFPLAPF
ncbi:MAG: patatin-like phospholipase family protein, partial [Bacteroidota bacterium]